jgi:hypothetical protein
MIQFSNHPAAISVSEGARDAWNETTRTWRFWLPVVLVAGTVVGLASAYATSATQNVVRYNAYTNEVIWGPDLSTTIWTFLAAELVAMAAAYVASCFFFGLAVSRLRGWPLTGHWIVRRGLLALWSGLIVFLGVVAVLILLLVIFVVSIGLGFLALLAAIVPGVYVAIRLSLSGVAIFDGAGPVEGLTRSWDLSRGSVLRIFGWGLVAGLLSLAFSIAGSVCALPFSLAGVQVGAQLISSLLTLPATVLATFMIAILYESQRARRDPSLYPPDPRWFAPPPGWWAPPGWTPSGLGPPPGWTPSYPPAPYPPGAYPPGAYPPYMYPPGAYPPGAYPPYMYPPSAYPPPSSPPAPYPPGAYPPGAYPPGPLPPSWPQGTGLPQPPESGNPEEPEA